VERIREPILKTLSDAKLTPAEINKIILIGGQTKMPLVQQFIEDAVGKKPERGIDPDGMRSHRRRHPRSRLNRRNLRHSAT